MGLFEFFHSLDVDFPQYRFVAVFFMQFYGGAERGKIAEFAHINAVAIGVSDLRGGAHQDDAFGFEAVEQAQNAGFKCGSTHHRIVHDYEGVFP